MFDLTGPMPKSYLAKLRKKGKVKVMHDRKELENRRLNRKQESG